MTTLTATQLTKIFGTASVAAAKIAPALAASMEKFDISTPARKAAFLAQVGHESGSFAYMAENLNYSAQALTRVFSKYFPGRLSESYARHPKLIASRVYANRMGNGNEASGEGYKFRGRGFIQLTGKSNYEAFATDMKISLDEAVQYLETIEGAAMSAAWFWHKNGLNEFADSGNFSKLTQRINGGQNGAESRVDNWKKAKEVLGS